MRAVAALREEDGLPQAVVQQPAVGQPGQRVVVGEEARFLLLALPLGDVLRHADHAVHPAGGVGKRLGVRRQPGDAAVLADHAVLVGAGTHLLPRRAHDVQVPFAVLRVHHFQVLRPARGRAPGGADDRRRIAAPVQLVGIAVPFPVHELGGVHGEAQFLDVFVQRGGGGFLRGDVARGAGRADHASFRVAQRHRVERQVHAAAVAPHMARFVVEYRFARQDAAEGRLVAVAHFRREQLSRAAADHLARPARRRCAARRPGSGRSRAPLRRPPRSGRSRSRPGCGTWLRSSCSARSAACRSLVSL